MDDPTNRKCRLTQGRYFVVLASLLVLGGLSFIVDYPVANWMAGDRLHHILTGDTYGVVRLGESFAHGIVVCLISLLIVRLDKRGWRVFPFLATSSLGAGILANFCKLLIARARPSKHHLIGVVWNSFGSWFPTDVGYDLQSFPSAHTAVAVGFAVALTRLYPRGAGFFSFFAALAILQRLDVGAHYVSDVVFGAMIGVLVSGLVAKWAPRLVEHPEADGNLESRGASESGRVQTFQDTPSEQAA